MEENIQKNFPGVETVTEDSTQRHDKDSDVDTNVILAELRAFRSEFQAVKRKQAIICTELKGMKSPKVSTTSKIKVQPNRNQNATQKAHTKSNAPRASTCTQQVPIALSEDTNYIVPALSASIPQHLNSQVSQVQTQTQPQLGFVMPTSVHYGTGDNSDILNGHTT